MGRQFSFKLFWVGLLVEVFWLGPLFLPAGFTAEEWKGEWDRVVAAAKKEGKVTIYSSGPGAGVDRLKVFKNQFEAAFPGIKSDYIVVASGSGSLFKIASERRAEKYIPDIYLGGLGATYGPLSSIGAFEPVRPALILPEVLDGSKWFEGKLWFLDNTAKFALGFSISASTMLAVNTKLVNPNDITSYKGLLDAKWRGKIGIRDVIGGGVGSSGIKFFYTNKELGPEYIKSLYGMDISLSRRTFQLIDWLAHGRAHVIFYPGHNNILAAQEQGLPVVVVNPQQMKEGYAATSGANNLLLMNRAPHPNAAKVFINWLLSREGQTSFEKTVGYPSLRVDTPTKHTLREGQEVKNSNDFMLVNHQRYEDLSNEVIPLLKGLKKR